MCGRFTLTRPAREVADHFGLADAPPLSPRYNVAPTQQVFAVRGGPAGAAGVMLRWGLLPPWAKDLRDGVRMLNARAETVADKPAFRAAFRRRRCLIAADGCYEWESVGGKKRPVHFRLRDGGVFALAGLWEAWQGPAGPVESCAVLTTRANELVAAVHDRMPVIVARERYAAWLAAETPAEELAPLLGPWPAEGMLAVAVGAYVNNARHEGPQCLEAA